MAEENPQDNCFECRKKKTARWREDFPVNWESDNYVTRREMVKFLALGSLTIAGHAVRLPPALQIETAKMTGKSQSIGTCVLQAARIQVLGCV
ncbi:MAG: hypothetical protein WCG81_12055 [Candidatus Angelobacter sp.]